MLTTDVLDNVPHKKRGERGQDWLEGLITSVYNLSIYTSYEVVQVKLGKCVPRMTDGPFYPRMWMRKNP